jgi:hypothetical protein
MHLIFDSSSWLLSALVILIPATLVCVALLCLVRKLIPSKELKKNHDVAGFTFGIIGVLYSVILGFNVINVQERYNQVQMTMHSEAMLLADLYQDAAIFSNEERSTIRTSLRNYVNFVVKEEWETSGKKHIGFHSRSRMKEVWNSYFNINLKDEKIKIWYTESISKLNQLMNARLSRQFNAREHLSGMMWALLVSGAAITICFMFFFGMENLRSHILMTSMLAGYLIFILYLLFSLDHVFKGPAGVKPTALKEVSVLFDQWDRESP